MKKRGFGAGKWNGPGGKVRDGETIEDACKREAKEEVGLTLHALEPRGVVDFIFKKVDQPDGHDRCFVFAAYDYTGEPKESEEMAPRWFDLKHIPWKDMWGGDELWFKGVIEGETVRAACTFDPDFAFVKIEKLDKV